MAQWSFYGRTGTLETLDSLVRGPSWFFCRIQGRRRIGKTTLLRELSQFDGTLLARVVYMQIPDSDERDVAASFRRALTDCESVFANGLAASVVDFASMASAIGELCRYGLIVVLDEFQYFTAAKLHPFNSFLQEQVDKLRDTNKGGLFILNYLAENQASNNGDLVAAVNREDDTTPLGAHLKRLVEDYRMVDKRQPVFSESASRNARYYITDNFLQSWLSVVKPARDTSRIRPLAKAIELAMPYCFRHEGFAFEKLIRQLHIECSCKGLGDFGLTAIELGFGNRARNVDNDIEIDIVALDADDRRVRFGSCKRSAAAHDRASLAKFDRHIERFLSTKEGRKVTGWTVEKALFSPVFTATEKDNLAAGGYLCRDLPTYAALFLNRSGA